MFTPWHFQCTLTIMRWNNLTNCIMQQHCLHSSIGVNGLSTFSYILDLWWVNMLYLLDLQRQNRRIKAGLKTTKCAQEYNNFIYSSLCVHRKETHKWQWDSHCKECVYLLRNLLNPGYCKLLYLCSLLGWACGLNQHPLCGQTTSYN